jgi:HEAT repeat protein
MSRIAMPLLFLAAACGLTSAQPAKEPAHDGKALSEWVKQLGSDDAAARGKAEDAVRALAGHPDSLAEALLSHVVANESNSRDQARALIAMGPRAVPALTAGLWDEKTRRFSLVALSRIGPDARAAAPAVLRLLTDPDDKTRASAAGCLGEINASSAIPQLTKALDDRSADVRGFAALSLAQLGSDPAPIVRTLIAELKAELKVSPIHSKRANVVLMLAELGPAAADAVPGLLVCLSDASWETSVFVARALARIGPGAKDAVPALKKWLADEKKDAKPLRPAVAVALWQIARDPDAVKLLREQLDEKTEVPGLRQKTINTLWRIDQSKETLEALAAQLKSENPAHAIAAAGVLGDKHKDAVPLLGKLLAHKEATVRAQAVVALHQLGATAAPVADALRAAAKDDDPQIAFWATSAVCRLDPKPDAVAALAGYLGDRDPLVRQDAARALGQLGAAGKPIVARLTTAMTDPEGMVRITAAVALWKIDANPTALRAAAELLRHPDPELRAQVAVTIGGDLGTDAKPLVPDLVKCLFDPYSAVRSAAAEALGRIGPGAKDAAPVLLALLDGDEPAFVQSAACEALGLIEPTDKDAAVAVLKKKLEHPDPLTRVHAALALFLVAGDKAGEKEADRALGYRAYAVRITAAEALWRMKQDDRAVPLLVRTLEESNLDGTGGENERYMAARALARIGPAAKPALAELTKLLRHPDPALAATAADAIKRIDTAAKK